MSDALVRLQELLLEQGGLLVTLLRPAEQVSSANGALDGEGSELARLAAAGPRTRTRAAEYELLVEAVYEGYLLHYGQPRILLAADSDLALLAGDRLYALGLDRLVAIGDIAGVAELADVITLVALAHGAGEAQLALAVWAAGARAVGWGSNERHERAKALARAGDPVALEAMRASALASS